MIQERTTPNLPSRDFALTATFVGRRGFDEAYRDTGCIILRRGGPANPSPET